MNIGIRLKKRLALLGPSFFIEYVNRIKAALDAKIANRMTALIAVKLGVV